MGPELMASHVWHGVAPFSLTSAGAPHCGQEIISALVGHVRGILEPVGAGCTHPWNPLPSPDVWCVCVLRVTRAASKYRCALIVADRPLPGRTPGHQEGCLP